MSKTRKTPQRKCIVTNEMKAKSEMIRIVKNKDGAIFVDPTGKQNGRGAYLTNDVATIERAREQKILEKTFKTKVDEEIFIQLLQLAGD